MGDFNEALTPAERRGATHTTLSMRQLRDLVHDLQLIDVEINQQFTWLRKKAASRIDRMMVSKEFVEMFHNLRVNCKHRMLSDHYPLALSTKQIV